MGHKTPPHTTWCESDKNHANNTDCAKHDDMSKEDRKGLLLEYLVHTGLALPPAVLYRNLRLKQNATFSEKTLHNYLDELGDAGLVKRIDPNAMEDRRVVEIDSGRGYWMATEHGREEASDSFAIS